MKNELSEGHKMWLSVMAVFLIYATVSLLFEDYDRKFLNTFSQASDWHLLLFSLLVMSGLGFLLFRYARRMDERISREQAEKENTMRRELTQNIAHELKTPTASILGYTETLLENPTLSDEVRQQFIERTHSQAQRLTALLQDITTSASTCRCWWPTSSQRRRLPSDSARWCCITYCPRTSSCGATRPSCTAFSATL